MTVLTDTLGERLAGARRLAGVGQDEMGLYVGASRPTVSKWERNITEPTVSQLILWARKTNQPVEAILDGLNVVCASRDSNPQPSDP
ncbi:helix-turn-helix domain-containing protein [Microbacterium sp. 22195]|uniref:helix-turn-helix domain-containing protein n=1 Tax=Microbacterium sp. 22195 TaxID=3453891 RepID=UPI003F841275